MQERVLITDFREQDIVEEASTLGLPPGRWPATFMHNGEEYTFFTSNIGPERELISVIYSRYDGVRLHVLND